MDKRNETNVEYVVANQLCTGCGACFGVCPSDAIVMEQNQYGNISPEIDADKCIRCGLCLNVCPGLEFNYVHFMEQIHGKLPDDVAIGPVLGTYAGFTKDKEVLAKAQSGGIVSEILIYGIENKIFDGAVVTGYESGNPFEPIVYIARTREEILKATGSKYCSVPAAKIIKELLETDGKYAFVGTPCQIHGMRKAEELIPELKEKIAIYVGLHCIGVYNRYYIDHVLKSIHLNKASVKKLQYKMKARSDNKPASTVFFEKTNGNQVRLDGSQYRNNLRTFFTSWRCYLCFDKLNAFSDISCGDCRISDHYDNQKERGISTALSDVIVRSERGEAMINQIVANDRVVLYKSSVADIITTTKVTSKMVGAKHARLFLEKRHWETPLFGNGFNNAFHQISFPAIRAMGFLYECGKLSKSSIYRKILLAAPNRILGKINRIVTSKINFEDLLMYGEPFFDENNPKRCREFILISGGQLQNKGAQAMTFTVIDEIRKRNIDKDIVLLSEIDFKQSQKEKKQYNFHILPYNDTLKYYLLGGIYHLMYFRHKVKNMQIGTIKYAKAEKNIFKNSAMLIDISGYGISSQWGWRKSLQYLFNIKIAKKYNIEMVILPQSFGPFKYKNKLIDLFLKKEMKKLLRYPKVIFAREKEGYKELLKFTKANLVMGKDIVLLRKSEVDSKNIYNYECRAQISEMGQRKSSIGIVPNQKIFGNANAEIIYNTYFKMIDIALKNNKSVILIKHSKEDQKICETIKEKYQLNNEVVFLNCDYSCIDLQSIISELDFLVASRYHSIVHAYRSGTPVIGIGWATKYKELMSEFKQNRFCFDVRNGFNYEEIMIAYQDMIQNYENEVNVIEEIQMDLSHDNIFDSVFERFEQ